MHNGGVGYRFDGKGGVSLESISPEDVGAQHISWWVKNE